MTCPICLKVGDTQGKGPNKRIPCLVQLLGLSSPTLAWKSLPHPKTWEGCATEECDKAVTEFLKLFQQLRILKQAIGQSLHRLLANLRVDCDLDVESNKLRII